MGVGGGRGVPGELNPVTLTVKANYSTFVRITLATKAPLCVRVACAISRAERLAVACEDNFNSTNPIKDRQSATSVISPKCLPIIIRAECREERVGVTLT